jgi:Flp pilus assembly protein TadD
MPDDLRIGYQAYRAGQFQDAIAAFGRAIDLGRLDRDALAVTLNNRGVAYSQMGNYDAAIADYLEARKLKPDDPTTIRNLRFAYVTRGLANANRGDRATALKDYDRALEIDPNYVEALQYRGALRVEMGANADATADFQRVLMLQPDNPAAVAALAALEGKPATAQPTPLAQAPTDTAVPLAAEGAAPDSVQATVARSQAAQDRAQAALDDALAAARDVEPTAPPEMPAATPKQPTVESAPSVAATSETAAPEPPAPTVKPSAPAEPEPEAQDSAEATPPPSPQPAPRTPDDNAKEVTPPGAEVGSDQPSQEESGQRYRVTASVNLRGGPGNSYGIIGAIPPGSIVTPDAENKGWYRIPRTGGKPGWVYRRFLAPTE